MVVAAAPVIVKDPGLVHEDSGFALRGWATPEIPKPPNPHLLHPRPVPSNRISECRRADCICTLPCLTLQHGCRLSGCKVICPAKYLLCPVLLQPPSMAGHHGAQTNDKQGETKQRERCKRTEENLPGGNSVGLLLDWGTQPRGRLEAPRSHVCCCLQANPEWITGQGGPPPPPRTEERYWITGCTNKLPCRSCCLTFFFLFSLCSLPCGCGPPSLGLPQLPWRWGGVVVIVLLSEGVGTLGWRRFVWHSLGDLR